jgi:uncharacterized protein
MNDSNESVTLVIQHEVLPARRDAYEAWLRDIAREAQRFPGHMGVNIIRPHGATTAYTMVLRFVSLAHLTGWVESETRRSLIARVAPLLSTDENLEIQTGMEFWFTPPSAKSVQARPLKQFLITLSAIFPLTVVVPWALRPLFDLTPGAAWLLVHKLVVAAVIVFLMVYVIMPRYTRRVASWLFR